MATQLRPEPDETPDSGAMADSELAGLLAAHEANAVSYFTSEISDEQVTSIDYYYGRPFGDEQAGRSQVVDRTVAIVVDNAVASLLRPFVSAQEVVSFEPTGPEDEEAAKQATDYVNYVFTNDNRGFLLLHDWFKAACLEKLGVIKCWWEASKQVIAQRLEGMDAQQLEEIVQQAGDEYTIIGGPYQDGELFAVDIERKQEDGRIKIITVPSEEFRIAPFARDIETAEYCAHVPTNIARSDLIEMGMDEAVVAGLPAATADTTYDMRSQSRWQDEASAGTRAVGNTSDPSRDLIAVRDEYIRVDFDRDGIAELRRVIRVNNEILLNEEADDNPFATLCPVPMPHKVYGLSLADQTRDLQRISSVLWRQTLDNLYLANNPKMEVPEGAATLDGSTYDDLADEAPGGVVRTRQPNMISPIAIPFVADKAFPMIEYAEHQQEARTGIGRGGQGIDTDTLRRSGQMTATEIAEIASGKNSRVEMIARIFAETGVKRLFRLMLKLMVNHQPRERVIRLRNKWVPIDPRSWNDQMDVTIAVGLGVGSKVEQIAQADSVLQTMAEVGQTPFGYMITAQNAYAGIKRKFTAAGVKNVDEFITEPKEGQEPPPQPDPDMMKVQGEQQMAQAKMQMDAQAQQASQQLAEQKAVAELQQSAAESQAKIDAQREQSAMTIQLAREKAQAELDLANQKMAAEMEMAERKMQMEYDLAERNAQRQHDVAMKTADAKISSNRPGGDLDK